MIRRDPPWQTGALARAGGIVCRWMSSESYLEATVSLAVFPAADVLPDAMVRTKTGCQVAENAVRTICDASGVTDGAWLVIRAAGLTDRVSLSALESAYDSATSKLGVFPAPERAAATADWWGDLNCADVVSATDPAQYGFETLLELDYSADAPSSSSSLGQLIEPRGGGSCELLFRSGPPGGVTKSGSVWVSTVPGGAVSFDTVEASEGSEPVDVAGALSARWARGLDPFEGSWNILAVSDGVNVLMVSDNGEQDLDRLVQFAEQMLVMLG